MCLKSTGGGRKVFYQVSTVTFADLGLSEPLLRALNAAKYQGPLSVEWEDMGMDREHGARESCQYVKNIDFAASARAFDAAFAE